MKTKITLFLAILGMITLQSCTVNENDNNPPVDNDTISEVFEVTRNFTNGNSYATLVTYPHDIYNSDMVLVYLLDDIVNGSDVWRQLPQTYYLNGLGELDYNFDFTKFDVKIFLDSSFNLIDLPSAWSQNQTFRIVIVPGFFVNKSTTPKANLSMDYESVVRRYNIKETQIQKLN
jgi:hypothetical protein